MFLHLSVCPQGGSASVHAGIPPLAVVTPLKGLFGSFPFMAVKIVKSISDLVEFKTLIKENNRQGIREGQIDLHDP